MDVSLRDFLRFSVAAGSATDLGTLVPLALYWRGGRLCERGMTTTAALVLLGGLFSPPRHRLLRRKPLR
jgi:hypothetical protein